MRNYISSILVTSALICGSLWLPPSAAALELPAGDEVIDVAWQSENQLVLLVRGEDGYALRGLDVAGGELAVIAAPRSFTNIGVGASADQPPIFALAPSGTALAVLERYDNPLQQADLSVYRIAQTDMEQVDTASIPDEFWPDRLAWSTDGEVLYLAARRFLFPAQPYSIGQLALSSERFSGVALKANIDLISSLGYIPQRNELIGICGGFRGEYPEQQMIGLISLNGTAQLLHSQADDHWLNILADGSVLIGADSGAANGELWLLSRSATQLTPAQCAFPESAGLLQSNRNGSWLGFLISGEQLELPVREGDFYLVIQRANDGKTVVTADSCSAFSFSPAGRAICTVNSDTSAVQFYSLPE